MTDTLSTVVQETNRRAAQPDYTWIERYHNAILKTSIYNDLLVLNFTPQIFQINDLDFS